MLDPFRKSPAPRKGGGGGGGGVTFHFERFSYAYCSEMFKVFYKNESPVLM